MKQGTLLAFFKETAVGLAALVGALISVLARADAGMSEAMVA